MSKVEHHRVRVNGINMHYAEAGDGPPVILLHGFPETSYAWRHQIAGLASSYRIIAPDLRGYGATEKPSNGYDKRTMARDIRALMEALGIAKAAIVGHDRGARVGTRFVKDYPEASSCFVAIDNIPTRIIFEGMTAKVAQAAWFFLFQGVRDLPEALIYGREEMWLRYILSGWTYNPELLTEDDFAVYRAAYAQPGALRGAFEDYRAWPEDLAQDQADAEVKIVCPVLAIWGEEFEAAKMLDMAGIWKNMASTIETKAIARAAHLPHEERPDAVNDALSSFLKKWM